MLNKKSNLVERRLYEYVLHAVCSPLRVTDANIPSEELAAHVAQLFNIDDNDHKESYMQSLTTQPCPVVLFVDVKKARNLLGEDQNGLSDPYCKVAVIYNPNESNGTNIIQTPPDTPSTIRRTSSLFSCASASSSKSKHKSSLSSINRKFLRRRRSVDRLQRLLSDKTKVTSSISYRTEVRPKTINPEWNEHFEFEIEHVAQQQLQVTVLDSDRGQEPSMKAILQEKRGFTKKIQGIRTLFSSGQIVDDFLGQITLNIKSLAIHNGKEEWVRLCDENETSPSNTKPRGEILLGFRVHFKLDDKKSRESRRRSNDSVVEFRRRHSILGSSNLASESIILRPSIFRTNFRPTSMRLHDFPKSNTFEDDLQAQINRNDSCLTPTVDSDSPLLIEEYHQLFRIVMLHQLEDARDLKKKQQSNEIFIEWDGSINILSHIVLVQFRVLYNIPALSESLIQLLVIMELRCSSDYAIFVSQGVIDGYLKIFFNNVCQRTNSTDLDFTNYEKTVFKEIFYLFIDHYKRRVHIDAPWYPPSAEYFPNIKSIFDMIDQLSSLDMCTNAKLIKLHLEETINTRIRTDINDCFTVNSFSFYDKDDMQINQIKELVQFVLKTKQSMGPLPDYQKHFNNYDVNYINICYFESNSAADRLSDTISCLLMSACQYFETYSKPMFKATSSIYDPNLIQTSRELLHLYLYIQSIVAEIRKNLESREWGTKSFKLKLNLYQQWFSPIMRYLIEGFVAQIRQTMERAIENDNELLPDDTTLHSQYSHAATLMCIEICQEWKDIDYPDVEVRYTALVKLTNTICEQCQQYARRTNKKLTENRYFTDLARTRSFNVSRKLCTLVNDIEFVKCQVLSSLPTLLNFSDVIEKTIEYYQTDSFKQLRTTLERLIATAEQEMTAVIKLILDHVAEFIRLSLKSKIKNYYIEERRGRPNCIFEVIRYINEEILDNLYKGLDPVQYSRIACAIRAKTIQCMDELLPVNEPADFYERVLVSFNHLVDHFDAVCRDEMNESSPPCEEIFVFQNRLEICALTTEQLQLRYFKEVLQMQPSFENLANNGEIILRVGHENIGGLITITVLVLACRKILKMDTFGTSDPYVILELLPSSIYHKQFKECRTTVQKRTLDPEYNEQFQWLIEHRLPTNVLNERGAVLRLSVWDKDMVNDDFIGECFISLSNIYSMKNLASIRDVPVTNMRLIRPTKNSQPEEFELIKSRIAFDEQAALFIKQRQLVLQSTTTSDGISMRSDDRNSAGSFSSVAIRSLLRMLPFNIGFGFDTNTINESDLAASDDDIV